MTLKHYKNTRKTLETNPKTQVKWVKYEIYHITELVKDEFLKIAKKRMKGIVSQAKTSGEQPTWIENDIWTEMWAHWDTPDAVEKSEIASQSRKSERGGLGVHKHLSGQKSYLRVHQEMEEELGRPVSLGEVFMRTHTKADGTFVDLKAKQVAEAYEKNLQEVMTQKDGDGPENFENSSETSTQRDLSIEQKNEIFLQCTEKDDKGNPFGLGQLRETIRKGKRKASCESSSSSSNLEMQEELQEAKRKLVQQTEDHQLALSRISTLEQLVLYFKNKDPEFAAFMNAQAQPSVPNVSQGTVPANEEATDRATTQPAVPANTEATNQATVSGTAANGSPISSSSPN